MQLISVISNGMRNKIRLKGREICVGKRSFILGMLLSKELKKVEMTVKIFTSLFLEDAIMAVLSLSSYVIKSKPTSKSQLMRSWNSMAFVFCLILIFYYYFFFLNFLLLA